MEETTELEAAKKKTDPPERKDPEELEAHNTMMEALNKRKAELDEQEARIEKRNREFKEMADELKMSGRGSAGGKKQSEDEIAKAAAMKLIEGSGFEKRIAL